MNEIHEYESEPTPGLPDHLPDGERVLWQGAPDPASLLRHAVHVRKIAAYFVILLALGLGANLTDGQPPATALANVLSLAPLAAVPVAILWLWGRAIARSTLYTLTSRRLMLRFGVALPVILNIPLRQIDAAGLKLYPDGTGDIPLAVNQQRRMSYLVLWPHVRPWRLWQVSPMLRSVPDAVVIAERIAEAWRAETRGLPPRTRTSAATSGKTSTPPLAAAHQ